jgi:soluble lytic murein transglycosylase
MKRWIKRFLTVLLLALATAAGVALFVSRDPVYTLHEWADASHFHRYDAMIQQIAAKYEVDPMLIKAVIWRESAFQPEMVGKDGERGLMQVTEAAAKDWATAQKMEGFNPEKLFDPETNIEAGTWYLKQSLQYYSGKDDPVPFALAEYNAGRRRVHQWIGDNNLGAVTANEMQENISFPSTRSYVHTTLDRYHFYKQRARM